MPWKPTDAKRHNKNAASGKPARQWSDVANSVLRQTGDEGRAVRTANGVVKKARISAHQAAAIRKKAAL